MQNRSHVFYMISCSNHFSPFALSNIAKKMHGMGWKAGKLPALQNTLHLNASINSWTYLNLNWLKEHLNIHFLIHLSFVNWHACMLNSHFSSISIVQRCLSYSLLARLLHRLSSTLSTSQDYVQLRQMLQWLSESIASLFPWMPAADTVSEGTSTPIIDFSRLIFGAIHFFELFIWIWVIVHFHIFCGKLQLEPIMYNSAVGKTDFHWYAFTLVEVILDSVYKSQICSRNS